MPQRCNRENDQNELATGCKPMQQPTRGGTNSHTNFGCERQACLVKDRIGMKIRASLVRSATA